MYSIVIALFILLFITLFEIVRKKEGIFDFLTFINLIFILLYSIAPMYMYFFNDHLTWSVLRRTDIHSTSFLLGELMALIFYVVMISCYYFANKLKLTKKLRSRASVIYREAKVRDFFLASVVLFIIGVTTWYIYMQSLGGYSEYMRLGELLRNDGSVVQTPLAFFKHFNSLLFISGFLFFSLIKETKGMKKAIVLLLFVISTILSFIILFQNSGRITLLLFIITIPLALMLRRNKVRVFTLFSLGALFLVLVLFGDQILKIGQDTSYTTVTKTKIEILDSVIREFAFPYNNLGNLIPLFPNYFDFRYGLPDITGAILQFIPSRLVSFDFLNNQTVSQFNTTLYNNYGQIPIDLVSFGYISFGIAGVILLASIFGVFIRFVESFFSYKESLIACIFYVCFMLQAALAVVYGDPHQVVFSNFKYVFSLILIAIIVRVPKKTTKDRNIINNIGRTSNVYKK
ncbi:O-antigen polymerase [Paenibacillus sp. FSL W7-1287]|uniref:O-antigen polymerase n=1 Tax=Paenibacillus sp. FSL W7-1287 TaxID=2954538 RepID=UPI0030F6B078